MQGKTHRSTHRSFSASPLAELAGACLDPVFARQGFAGREVVALWASFAGEALAERSRPLKIRWPRRSAGDDAPEAPAVLLVRCESAFALELQHLAPVVLARVNAHLGWPAVGRIAIEQGPVPRREAGRRAPPQPSPEDAARIAAATEPVAGEALKAALVALGRNVMARKGMKHPG